MVNPPITTKPESDFYIGIMSGTSMDGVDAALVKFDANGYPTKVASHSSPFPTTIKNKLLGIINPSWSGSLSTIASLNTQLGALYAETAATLIKNSGVAAQEIAAIGNHGQTIWHQPHQAPRFSWQLGDANHIAETTGVTTIADFRNRDIAAGGEGAPLVPAFHEAVFSSTDKNRVILNIGGISNITLLSADHATIGFDTGPGNSLLDAWCFKNQGLSFDQDGQWGASGTVAPWLLRKLMQEPYFKQDFPKSTGKELFNLHWLQDKLTLQLKPEDVQATLVEVTALSIADGIKLASNATQQAIHEVYVCGGGCKNLFLMKRLSELLPDTTIEKTDRLGVEADWVEAIAFAWLARQTMLGQPGNLPSATGANGYRVLGAIYPA